MNLEHIKETSDESEQASFDSHNLDWDVDTF